jgi:hypothetical protein
MPANSTKPSAGPASRAREVPDRGVDHGQKRVACAHATDTLHVVTPFWAQRLRNASARNATLATLTINSSPVYRMKLTARENR